MITEAEKDQVEDTCRLRLYNAMVVALKEVLDDDWPSLPEYSQAASSGAINGVADLLIELILKVAGDPDTIAAKVAGHIQMRVAASTSGGAA